MRSEDELLAEIHSLSGLRMNELREVWQRHFGQPPKVRSGDFFRRCLAEKLQQQHYGVDRDLERALSKLAATHRVGKEPRRKRPKIRPGVILVREWGGESHKVEAIADGFLWRGEKHRSLSALAERITGARWNGYRFFGLTGGAP